MRYNKFKTKIKLKRTPNLTLVFVLADPEFLDICRRQLVEENIQYGSWSI